MSNMAHPVPASIAPVGPGGGVSRIEHGFEIVVFASRWIQAPLYAGLIVAELLYAYKFLAELWHMVFDIRELTETVFMLGVLSLVDITMVANLLTMVVIGGHATFVSRLGLEGHEGPAGLAEPRRSRYDQGEARRLADRHLQHSSAQSFRQRGPGIAGAHPVEDSDPSDLSRLGDSAGLDRQADAEGPQALTGPHSRLIKPEDRSSAVMANGGNPM